jgi:hypothetical protein
MHLITGCRKIQQGHFENLGIDMGDQRKGKASDAKTTWTNMLSSIYRVSEGMAESIVELFPTFRSLFEAYDACATVKDREELLAGLQVTS